MADSADLGFVIHSERIPLREETLRICKLFNLNPLALISSGALLIASPREKANEILRALAGKGINASVIGEFIGDPTRRVIVESGSERLLERPKSDELWKVV